MMMMVNRILLFMIIGSLFGCAAQKELVATGGSRADGTIKLSFDYGMFEKPVVDPSQALNVARKRCSAWGYKDAEPFGGQTSNCSSFSNGNCNRWIVTVEYQCLGDLDRK